MTYSAVGCLVAPVIDDIVGKIGSFSAYDFSAKVS